MLQLNARVMQSINPLRSHTKKRLTLEIVKVLITSKTHFSCHSCVQFYKLILNKKNVLEEIHSSDKYSTFMENLSDCNKSTCITSSSSSSSSSFVFCFLNIQYKC